MRFGLRASDYKRAREWLDDNDVTREEFKKMFNEQLDRAKGDEWQKEGLFLLDVEAEKRKEVTRKQFFASVGQLAEQKRKRVGFVNGRKRAFINLTIRGKRYRRGQFVPLNARERSQRVKKSSPSGAKKSRRRG